MKRNVTKNSCKLCKVNSLSTREIGIHMKIEHPKERLFDCDECGYRLNWTQNITMHENGSHRTKLLLCSNCTFASFWKNLLFNHARKVHGFWKTKLISRFKEQPSSLRLCDFCGFQATNYHAMVQHKNKKNLRL